MKEHQEDRWEMDYEVNRLLRGDFRIRKAEEIEKEKEDAKPKNFALPILDESEEDLKEARKIKFRTNEALVNQALKRQKIMCLSGI